MMRSGLTFERQCMTGAAIGTDDVIITLKEGTGFVEVGEFAVGKNDDALHNICLPLREKERKSSEGGG